MPCTKYLERTVVESIIRDLLAHHFLVTVNDGEEDVLCESTDLYAIMDAMFSTDGDNLIVTRNTNVTNLLAMGDEFSPMKGWIRLIYGNSGYDVINDYTVNLEVTLARTMALIREMER